MALKMTLNKESNILYHEFTDAYWKVDSIQYDTESLYFALDAYPSREASKMQLQKVEPTLPIVGARGPVYEPILYTWNAAERLVSIFPQGIPLDPDAQKTAIYNWVKTYTGLPFEDVFEEE